MLKKQTILIVLMLLSFCGWVYSGEKPPINISSANPDSRIAIMTVPFLTYNGNELALMKADDRFHTIIASTLEKYLQEKGYAAFYIGNDKDLLTKDEIAILFKADLVKAIKNQSIAGTKVLDVANVDASYFKKVYKIFYPVFAYKTANIAATILGGPGNLEVTIYGFLLDCRTGEIIWSNKLYMTGNYNAIDLNLRGSRWGHGCMWQVIKTLKTE